MEIEKQRGISVASSVMQMEYRDCVINLLDTPGHQDFSEDTYRVLTAVDAALMVIDAANGVEPQTIRLLQVCRARNTPIITFINKLDREVQEPLNLLSEIEDHLGMEAIPFAWPCLLESIRTTNLPWHCRRLFIGLHYLYWLLHHPCTARWCQRPNDQLLRRLLYESND